MECKTYLGTEHKDEVLIYSKTRTSLVDEIEKLVSSGNTKIIGTLNDRVIQIHPMDVSAFISENNKTYAFVKNEKYQIKDRLYQIEEIYPELLLKINQSCIVNVKRIKSFHVSIGGALMITLDNGYKDYVARREVKNVKIRMGL